MTACGCRGMVRKQEEMSGLFSPSQARGLLRSITAAVLVACVCTGIAMAFLGAMLLIYTLMIVPFFGWPRQPLWEISLEMAGAALIALAIGRMVSSIRSRK